VKFRRFHRLFGLVTVVGLVLVSATGILLNTPSLIPQHAAIQDMVSSPDGRYLLTDAGISMWKEGQVTPIPTWHPIGAGDRLIPLSSGVGILHNDGVITLYRDGLWDRILLPGTMGWITQVDVRGDQWLITTSTGVWESLDNGHEWVQIIGPYPESIRDQIKKLHSGWYFGRMGSIWITATGWLTLLLSITGVLLYRRRK
jgi:hypothetical protein